MTVLDALRLRLDEYESVVVPDLTPEQALALQFTDALSVEPAVRGFTVRAHGMVGAISVPGVHVTIYPKVGVARLLYLIGYANDPGWHSEELPVEHADDLVNAIAEALCFHTERAFSAGVLQGYRHREEALLTIRGRVRTSDHITRRFGLPVPVEVAYDEYDVDILENQLLRTALRRLLLLPGMHTTIKERLRHWHSRLDGVSEFPPGPTPAVQFTRLNERYRQALILAQLVLAQQSIEFGDGRIRGQAFMVRMHQVFERFLGAALTRAFEPYGGSIVEQVVTMLDIDDQIDVRPDIVWRRDGSVRAVVDAKYKSLDGTVKPVRDDLYQALAYCVAHDLSQCWLVYAGPESATHFTMRHHGATLRLVALDLDQDVDLLHRQVEQLASKIAGSTP